MSHSNNEKRIIERVKKIDELSDDPHVSRLDISQSDLPLTPDERAQLMRAERALGFLDDIRRTVKNEIVDRKEGDSVRFAQDTTDLSRSFVIPPSPEPDLTGSSWDRFKIVRELGQGGFAKVFLANDPKLDRLVALKIPRPSALFDDQARERFEREARAASGLSHPSIVPLYETGFHQSVNFIVYGYCPGKTLAEWLCQQTEVPLGEAVAITTTIAEAVQHAHSRGVVHRDLKPGNVLLDQSEANEIAKQIRVTDFGLAKKIETNDQTLTYEGAVVGTPAYMSPEQARGELEVGPSTDIFSIGVILYQLLTGVTPFKRKNHIATLQAIENEQPVAPSKLRRDVPPDLEAICLKCLNKDVEHRYLTAFDLQQDLEAWSSGLPIKARRSTSLEKLVKWYKRNPAVSASITFAAACLGVGLILTTWKWRESNQNLRNANQQNERAEIHLSNLQKSIDSLNQVIEKTKNVPNIGPLRKQISVSIDEVQNALLQVEPNSFKAQKLLIDARIQTAEGHLKLEDFDATKRTIDEIKSILESMSPQSPSEHRLYAQQSLRIMQCETTLYTKKRMYKEARRTAQRAIEELESMKLSASMIRGLKGWFLKQLAVSLERLGHLPEAENAFNDALQLMQYTHEDSAADEERLSTVCDCLNSMAVLMRKKGDEEKAIEYYDRALGHLENLLAISPMHQHHRGLYATINFNIGNLFFSRKRWEKVEHHYDLSKEYLTELAEDFPENRFFASTLLTVNSALATAKGKNGKYHEAEAALQDNIRMLDSMPPSYDRAKIRVRSQNNLARLYSESFNDYEKAEQAYLKTMELAETAMARFDNPSLVHSRLLAAMNIAEVYFYKEQFDMAKRYAVEAHEMAIQNFGKSPVDQFERRRLAATYENLGLLAARTGDMPAMKKWFDGVSEIAPTAYFQYKTAQYAASAYSLFTTLEIPHELSAEQLLELQRYALSRARTAIESGFVYQALEEDDAWLGFFNHAEYHELLNEMKKLQNKSD